MNTPDLEAELQAKTAELTGMEKTLLEMHSREWTIRQEIAAIEEQKRRAMDIPHEPSL